MYTVVKEFVDVKDGHYYHVGDEYPHEGKPNKARVAELTGKKNAAGVPLIKEVKPAE